MKGVDIVNTNFTATLDQPRTCPAWCTQHDAEPDICSNINVHLDFRGDGHPYYLVDGANVSLAGSADEGVTMFVGITGVGYGQIGLSDAKRLASEILEQVRQAEAGLIPGPRTAPEGESLS